MNIKWIVVAVLVACGGELEATDVYTNSDDLSAKFSGAYTYGLSSAGTSRKCTVALGAGTGQDCILPGYANVKFKISGTDPYELNAQMSWKAQARRALTDSFPNYVAQVYGYGIFPWTVAETTSSNYIVELTSGTCPGAFTSNDITAFACILWSGVSNMPVMTESFPGQYRRFTGQFKVIFDVAKMQDRTNYHAPPGSTALNHDFHELVEHAAHALAPSVFGSGIYNSNVDGGSNKDSWSSPSVESALLSDPYAHAGYAQGEACRASSWVNSSTGQFTQQSGSCPN
jgi:hypothetical protein